MTPRLAIFVLLLTSMFSDGSRAADLFVSPIGSDSNSGTADKPLKTLAAAQEAARLLKTQADGKSLTITVAGGIYYLDDTLRFTAEDSGTKTAPMIWQAAPGQHVIISGGRRLDLTWTPYKDGILQAKVPEDLTTDQLFVNGERQILARYPNYDPNVLIFNGYAADCISPERVARWADPAGGYMHAMHPAQWGGFSYLITGKDGHGGVTLEGGWQGNRRSKPHAKLRYVENIFEELDAPGEWFLNNKTHVLYYYPPEGLDLAKAEVEAVRLKHLIEFHGTEQAPVKWITLSSFTLCQTARTFMETKEPILRSDWTIYRGGAVLFDGAEDCTLADSFLDQVGGNAVFVNNYNRRIIVRGCRIDKSGAGGVMFVGDPKAVRSPLFEYGEHQSMDKIDKTPGPLTDNYPADCRVEDCLITQCGRVEKQSTGVGMDMCARITVSHCSIYDMPRAGINIGDGCWGGHIIEFCDVFDTVKETGDHGSFNSWGRDRYWAASGGEVNKRVAADPKMPLLDVVEPITLANNRWRCDHGWDIDLDDGSSNYHIYNNLCLHGGLKNREGFHRTVENNIMVNNTFHPHVWFADSQDAFAHNIVFDPYKPVGMPKRWGKQIDDNLLHSPGATSSSPAAGLQKISKQDEHSLQGDAMFADPAHGDFTVKEGSPALALGFKNFPMTQFGVTSPSLRAIARTPSFAAGREDVSRRDPSVRDWLGAKVRNILGLGEQSAHGLTGETGVLVLDLPASGALAKAGVRANDVIVEVNGATIDTVADLVKASRNASGPMKLKVSRDQQPVELTVKP